MLDGLWVWGGLYAFKFRRGRRYFGAGHGRDFKDDGPEFFLGDPFLATGNRQKSQAAKEGRTKAHGFSRKRRLYFLNCTLSPYFLPVCALREAKCRGNVG